MQAARTFDEGESAEEHDEDKDNPGQVEGDHHGAADSADEAEHVDGHLVRQRAQQPEREEPAQGRHTRKVSS
jgi:hypothetical protein